MALSIEIKHPNKTHLPRSAAADYLGVKPATLAKWAMTPGRGPLFIKLGTGRSSRVLYAIADLDAFLRSGQVHGGQAA